MARGALVGREPVLLGLKIAQGGVGGIDLYLERGQVFGQAGCTRALIAQLRLDGPALVDNLRKAIGAALELRAQLIECGRV